MAESEAQAVARGEDGAVVKRDGTRKTIKSVVSMKRRQMYAVMPL